MFRNIPGLFGCVLTVCNQVSVPSGHPRVVNALLFGILCDRPRAPTFFRRFLIFHLHPHRDTLAMTASACRFGAHDYSPWLDLSGHVLVSDGHAD